jgi:hypothetical protein
MSVNMAQLIIPMDSVDREREELKRLIGFASSAILSVDITSNSAIITITEDAAKVDTENKVRKILKMMFTAPSLREEVICRIADNKVISSGKQFVSDQVRLSSDGFVSMKGDALALLNYFDSTF